MGLLWAIYTDSFIIVRIFVVVKVKHVLDDSTKFAANRVFKLDCSDKLARVRHVYILVTMSTWQARSTNSPPRISSDFSNTLPKYSSEICTVIIIFPLQLRHMRAMASQMPGNSTVCSIIYSGWQNRKHRIAEILAFVRRALVSVSMTCH